MWCCTMLHCVHQLHWLGPFSSAIHSLHGGNKRDGRHRHGIRWPSAQVHPLPQDKQGPGASSALSISLTAATYTYISGSTSHTLQSLGLHTASCSTSNDQPSGSQRLLPAHLGAGAAATHDVICCSASRCSLAVACPASDTAAHPVQFANHWRPLPHQPAAHNRDCGQRGMR